jgi:hypothetical protein
MSIERQLPTVVKLHTAENAWKPDRAIPDSSEDNEMKVEYCTYSSSIEDCSEIVQRCAGIVEQSDTVDIRRTQRWIHQT